VEADPAHVVAAPLEILRDFIDGMKPRGYSFSVDGEDAADTENRMGPLFATAPVAEPVTVETPAGWAILLEDYLVACARRGWAKKRNLPTSGPKQWKPRATADYKAHTDEVRATRARLFAVGGEALSADPADRARANRIARARIENDLLHGRCQCASPDCARGLLAGEVEKATKRWLRTHGGAR
jgi:hypothetical protein